MKELRGLVVLVALPCWLTAQFIPAHVPAIGIVLGLALMVYAPLHLFRHEAWWPRIHGGVFALGVMSNALALLIHKGSMPVTGRAEASGVWRPYEDGDVLFLVDRFGGFSIGDIVIGLSVAMALIVWTITSVIRAAKQEAARSAGA